MARACGWSHADSASSRCECSGPNLNAPRHDHRDPPPRRQSKAAGPWAHPNLLLSRPQSPCPRRHAPPPPRRHVGATDSHASAPGAGLSAPAPLPHGTHGAQAQRGQELLKGRHVAVLWDIENVKPWGPTLTIPVQVHRIQRTFEAWGCASVSVKTAINPSNMERLASSGVLELLLASGVHIHLCGGFLDAADVELQNHALAFAQEHRQGRSGAIVVISNDADFCEILRYCASWGCFTVSMAPHHFRPTAAMLPGPPLHKAPLPGACHLALMWQQLPGMAVTEEEQRWLDGCLQRCQLSSASSSSGGRSALEGAEAVTASAGVALGRRLVHGSRAGYRAVERKVKAAQRLPSWPSMHSPGSLSHVWLNPDVMARFPP